MKQIIKAIARRLVKHGGTDTAQMAAIDALRLASGSLKISQLSLLHHYRAIAASNESLPALSETGFRVYSQTDEDGIILFIFGLIGMRSRNVIEICSGDGIECNAANLLINQGWTGLLVDGDIQNVTRGRTFYRHHNDTVAWPPTFIHAWITRENVNSIIKEGGYLREVDLLSLDLDGVDYWIWEAINCIDPRVVVLEYQDILGPVDSLTVPYASDFRATFDSGGPAYGGASLPAFVKLATRKGYRLVGVNRYGFNAFFVKRGICEDQLPEVPAASCFTHPKVIAGMRDRLPTVKGREWIEV